MKRACYSLLLSAAVVLLPHSLAAQIDGDRVIQGSSLIWREELPLAGQLVQARVRGKVLATLLQPGTQWRLTADGNEIQAQLRIPQPPDRPEVTALEITQHSSIGAQGFFAVLDRGVNPVPINRLQLRFANPKVSNLLQIEGSVEGDQYVVLGPLQLLHQEVVAGSIMHMTDVECPATNDQRYIRLGMPDGGGIQLDQAAAWLEPSRDYGMYLTPAALGAMRVIDGEEHLWPLLLACNGVPLVKVKLIADAPGAMRQIRAVRLSDVGIPVETVAEAIWADRISVAGITRSEKWLVIDAPAGDGRPWGFVVNDRGAAPLQLTSVQAYAIEGSLIFHLPQSREVALWLQPAQQSPLVIAEDVLQAAPVVGLLAALNLEVSPRKDAPASAGRLRSLARSFEQRGILVLTGSCALIALVIAIALLHHRQSEGVPDA